nr:MAG TPA: hypothetical protein [Caudoviricetes sp.]
MVSLCKDYKDKLIIIYQLIYIFVNDASIKNLSC